MHGYPVMQVVQYSVPPCSWPPPVDSHRSSQPTSVSARSGIRKYVVWCLICGGLSCLLGIMFLGVYFLVRSYTSTIGYFETVPTFVPATLLMLTGLCIISLARRRNRYSYLIKLSGACGLSSALTCALVTVTTTVIHMSRLQALRECEYTRKTRTCTCYSVETTHTIQDDGSNLGGNDEIGYRFVFDSADECTVVHNALYSCLRAIFGISVAGVLVAVFSCMLVYQLLSHERKKMIWEQLELRRRQAYGQSPPGWPPLGNGPSIIGTPRNGPCRCCEQCHSHRNMLQSSYSWDSDRFWSAPPPNGYYGQGADDHLIVSRMVNQQTQRPGWSWPRFPWQRNDNQQRFRQTPSSPDSQYGFSTNVSRLENNTTNMMQSYTLINNPHHFGIWGPPPPYSDPNSPVRRNRYLYNHCQPITEHSSVVMQPMSNVSHQSNLTSMDCTQPMVSDTHSIEQICATPTHTINHRIKNRLNAFKAKDTNEAGTLSDSDTQRDSMHSNTLPFRKARKKIDNGAKSIGSNQSTSRVNVQNIFSSTQSIGSRMTENNGGFGGGVGGSGGNIGSSSNGNIGSSGLRATMNDNIPGCSTGSFNMHSKMKNSFENTGYQSMEDIIGRTQAINNYAGNNAEQTMNVNGSRDMFARSRLAFHSRGDYEKFGTFNANVQAYASISPHNSHSGANSNSSHSLPKDLTRYSICSAESEKTEYTDVSPMLTPSTPYTTDDSNAITLAFQRELKQQQQQQQHHQQLQQQKQQQQQRSFNQIKDHSEASASTSTPLYSTRYLDGGVSEHKRDTSSMLRTKNTVPDIHIRAATHLLSPANLTVSDSNDPTSLDPLNGSSSMYSKFTERRSVYQRPTYSFASGHSSSGGHSHHGHSSSTSSSNVKHTILSTATPKKRNLYANHSVGSPRSTMTGGDIDLVRLTNMRKEAAVAAAAASTTDEPGGKTKDEQRKAYESHSKVLNENDWPDHNNDRRL